MEQHTHAGRVVTLGKTAARYDPRTFKAAKYVLPELPEPAAARDLTIGVPWIDDALGNDYYPLCTYAALANKVQLLQQSLGLPVTVTAGGVIDGYCKFKGITRAQLANDGGANMLDLLKWARKNGICGVRVKAFMAYAPTNRYLERVAVDLFGGPYVGLSLPRTAQSQDVWDVVPGMVPGDWGGHAVNKVSNSPKIDCYKTWGMKKPSTPAFDDRCSDEKYVVLFEDLTPIAGIDMVALEADLALL